MKLAEAPAPKVQSLKKFPIERYLTPFKHRLLVHVIPAPDETTTASGLIISRRAREAEMETTECGKIIRTGNECHPDLAPGVWVMLPRFCGTRVIHEHTGDPEADYRIIPEDSIMVIIDPEEVARKYEVT